MNRRKAFTLIEIMVVLVLSTAIALLCHRAVSYIGFSVMRGNAELQNLDNARSAINYIRRDFMVSSPMFMEHDTYSDRYLIKSIPIVSGTYSDPGPQPMQVNENSILLYKNIGRNIYEIISYEFIANENRILRTSTSSGTGKSREVSFDGIKKAVFKLYTLHENLNPYIPILWIDLTVESGHGRFKRNMDLSTSVVGSIISNGVNNLYWNDTR